MDTDGYLDRAFSDLGSYFLSASHHGARSLLQADVFSGREQTYQAWYGIEESMLKENRTYNEAGSEKAGEPYDNQTDNYQQNYYQLHYRSEEHTSELQSRGHLVCRLLLEKKKKQT